MAFTGGVPALDSIQAQCHTKPLEIGSSIPRKAGPGVHLDKPKMYSSFSPQPQFSVTIFGLEKKARDFNIPVRFILDEKIAVLPVTVG